MAYANLATAKEAKKDEFYTDLQDIQSEMSHYFDKFKDKVVLCNCDDPFESNFVKYFLMNFNRLGLKRLIATGYNTSNIDGAAIGATNTPYALSVTDTSKYLVGAQKDLDISGTKYFLETEGPRIMTPLIGNPAMNENGEPIKFSAREKYIDVNTGKTKTKTAERDLYYEPGDFRSDMSVSLLLESDIVVTNPPFSLFREFVSLIEKHKKQFLIIGNQNAITYKEIFPLIKENKMWLGYGFPGNVGFFQSPYEDTATSSQKQKGKIRISGVMWFTNIDHPKRHQMLPLDLGCVYNGHEEMYPKYDNYDAINVNKTAEIPCDYTGVMGVPITFLDAFCPDQFEILGLSSKNHRGTVSRLHENDFYNGYTRGKVITRIESNMPILNVSGKGGTLCKKEGSPNLYQLYWRIFIRFKDEYIQSHPEWFAKG